MKTSKVVLIKLSGFGASPKQADWLDSVLGTTRSRYDLRDLSSEDFSDLSANETCRQGVFSADFESANNTRVEVNNQKSESDQM